MIGLRKGVEAMKRFFSFLQLDPERLIVHKHVFANTVRSVSGQRDCVSVALVQRQWGGPRWSNEAPRLTIL